VSALSVRLLTGLLNKKLIYRRQTARRICTISNGVADPQNTPLPVCVTMPNLVVLRQTVYVQIGEPQKANAGAATPLWDGAWLTS